MIPWDSKRELSYKELEELLALFYFDEYHRILEVWHYTKPKFRFYGSLLARAKNSFEKPPQFNEFVRAYNKEAKAFGGKMMRYIK